MPYIIKKVKEEGKTGYKVCKRDEPSRCFSKHGMTEKKAKKQRTAIIMSEMGISRKTGGDGSDSDSEEYPTTVNGIKEYLNFHGFEVQVFELLSKKPKLADWKKLLEETKPIIIAKKLQERRTTSVPSKIHKSASEAFAAMKLRENKS